MNFQLSYLVFIAFVSVFVFSFVFAFVFVFIHVFVFVGPPEIAQPLMSPNFASLPSLVATNTSLGPLNAAAFRTNKSQDVPSASIAF